MFAIMDQYLIVFVPITNSLPPILWLLIDLQVLAWIFQWWTHGLHWQLLVLFAMCLITICTKIRALLAGRRCNTIPSQMPHAQ